MGGVDAGSQQYSSFVAVIFIFNLIVGTGVLALPRAFLSSGLVLGSLFLVLLCFLAYITITFMIEVLSIANALQKSEPNSDRTPLSRSTDDSDVLNTYGRLSLTERPHAHMFEITDRVEVSAMAEMFLGPIGHKLFFIVIIIYLYGDLAIYATAVPNSLLAVTGGWGPFSSYTVYWLYLGIFTLILTPFTFFDFQRTRYLQILTMLIRNVSLFMMIILVTIYDFRGEGSEPSSWFNFAGVPDIFGAAIYAFMCHHSLPSIITPIKQKNRLNIIIIFDLVCILCTYLLLCWTAIWAFGDVTNPTCAPTPGPPCMLQKLYTLNFASFSTHGIAVFLVLFPVFTLSSNFPLIAITLRNNLMQLITWRKDSTAPTTRRIIFALITVLPPIFLSFFIRDVELLVSITGSYAGLGIMFFFPALLVQYARKKAADKFGAEFVTMNKHSSPFTHVGWIYMIYVWCVLALGGVIFRQIYVAVHH